MRTRSGAGGTTTTTEVSVCFRLRPRPTTLKVPAIEEEKRHFIQKLGFRILREVNDAAVAGATSVSSTVLLAAPESAIRYGDFVVAARGFTELLLHKKVTLTASLHRNIENFYESLNFLQNGKLIEWMKDRDGDIIHLGEVPITFGTAGGRVVARTERLRPRK